MNLLREGLEVYSTCPQSKDENQDEYVQRIIDVAKSSDEFGCHGILVYTDNGIVDPWLVSQIILENTTKLCPLVAIQPVYMHPYTAAKMVATLGFLHRRKLCLNMLAGGFKNDLIALGDETPHDDRYVRTTEYAQIMTQLLSDDASASFEGKYYTTKNLKMTPPLPPELMPEFLVSGSSAGGMAAARAIGATAVKYPLPPEEEVPMADSDIKSGVRVGIIARDDSETAWKIAHERFPSDRRGQITHKLAMKVSDSSWHKQLSESGEQEGGQQSCYWLGPFQNSKTFCPYLVGSYEETAAEVAKYIGRGYTTFILDIPPSREELEHTSVVFEKAMQSVNK